MMNDFTGFRYTSARTAPTARRRLSVCAATALALSLSLPAAAHPRHKPKARPQPPATVEAPASKDPLLLVVSRGEQKIDVFRGDDLALTSNISTGRKGLETPAGVFSILGKNRWHRSNIYSGAPMPFMQRITWSGVALHAGHVPNYPASHGCIRLPPPFATKLFGLTSLGNHVVVVDDPVAPSPIANKNLFQPSAPVPLSSSPPATEPSVRLAKATAAGDPVPDAAGASGAGANAKSALFMADFEADLARMQAYAKRSTSPLRIFITRRTGRERVKDVQLMLKELGYHSGDIDGLMGPDTGKAIQAFQRERDLPANGTFSEALVERLSSATGKGAVVEGHIYIRQDFKQIFDAPVRLLDPDRPLGTHLYVAMNFEPRATETQWIVVTPKKTDGAGPEEALDRIALPDAMRQQISELLTPGSSLIISDNGISGETAPVKGTDFVVLTE